MPDKYIENQIIFDTHIRVLLKETAERFDDLDVDLSVIGSTDTLQQCIDLECETLLTGCRLQRQFRTDTVAQMILLTDHQCMTALQHMPDIFVESGRKASYHTGVFPPLMPVLDTCEFRCQLFACNFGDTGAAVYLQIFLIDQLFHFNAKSTQYPSETLIDRMRRQLQQPFIRFTHGTTALSGYLPHQQLHKVPCPKCQHRLKELRLRSDQIAQMKNDLLRQYPFCRILPAKLPDRFEDSMVIGSVGKDRPFGVGTSYRQTLLTDDDIEQYIFESIVELTCDLRQSAYHSPVMIKCGKRVERIGELMKRHIALFTL